MYNRHLDSFLSVAETGSFSKAAEASHISRTALIQQINLLEEHVGFPLFVRTSKGARLTPMGKLLAERSYTIMKLSSETLAQCQALHDVRRVRIGILPNLPLPLLGPICIAYNKAYPESNVQFVERTSSEYLSAFYNNEFDVSPEYMSRLVSPRQEICFARLAVDRFDCAVPPSSPLAQQDVIRLEDLNGRRVCLFVADLATAEDRLRAQLLAKGKNIQLVDIESYTKSLPLTCILEDMLLLHYHITEREYEPLVSRPFDAGGEFPVELGLCYKPDASREVRCFVSFAEDYCRRQGLSN